MIKESGGKKTVPSGTTMNYRTKSMDQFIYNGFIRKSWIMLMRQRGEMRLPDMIKGCRALDESE